MLFGAGCWHPVNSLELGCLPVPLPGDTLAGLLAATEARHVPQAPSQDPCCRAFSSGAEQPYPAPVAQPALGHGGVCAHHSCTERTRSHCGTWCPGCRTGQSVHIFLISLELFVFRFTLGKQVSFSLVYSLCHLQKAPLVFSSPM